MTESAISAQKGEISVQICPKLPTAVRELAIELDPAFPICAPVLDRQYNAGDQTVEEVHEHPVWEIGICTKGSGVFEFSSGMYRYATGDVSVVAPGMMHAVHCDPDSPNHWERLYVDFEGLLGHMPPECAALAQLTYTGVLKQDENPLIAPLVLLLLDEMYHQHPQSKAMIRLKTAELALYIHRMKAQPGVFAPLPDSLNDISPAVLYIVNHYQENITLAELAAMCSKSVTSFRRFFSKTMHTSPFEFLYSVRIKAAVNLLQTTSLPVSDVASRVGYQSLSSFNRHFRRLAGMSPLACRKQKEMDTVQSPPPH